MNYLLSYNILSPRQFGFRPGNSMQEALYILYVTNDWHHHMVDHGLSESVASVFFNLSKTFAGQGPTQSTNFYSHY